MKADTAAISYIATLQGENINVSSQVTYYRPRALTPSSRHLRGTCKSMTKQSKCTDLYIWAHRFGQWTAAFLPLGEGALLIWHHVHKVYGSLNVWRHSSRLVNNARHRPKTGVWFDLWPLTEIRTNSTPTLPSKYRIHHACTVYTYHHTRGHTCGQPKVSFQYQCFDWPTEVTQTNQNKPSYGSFQSLH